MARARLTLGTAVLLITGCAAPATQSRTPEPQPRVDQLERAQARLEARFDEMARNLLALRDRIDAQAAAPTATRPVDEPVAVPSLKVVKLEPPTARPEPAPPAVESAASDLYRRAFNAYRERRFGASILDFEEFLRQYPDHDYADNAQYWIGDSYYSQGEYGQAIVELNRVLELYPNEAKASDALLKIALCYEKLGELEKAKVFVRRLLDHYPQSDAARQVRARPGSGQ